MNGKQAKRLRKAAMGLAVTLEQQGKKMSERGQEVQKTTSHQASSVIASYSNLLKPPVETTHVVNQKNSVRFIYQQFKKGVASGKIKS